MDDFAFTGSFEEIQEYFHSCGWSDGLPVVPPTAPAVERFLNFSDRSPAEVLGTVLPSHAEFTVRTVAVNGVMAGCRPEYMPVLVAIAQVLASPDFGTKDAGSTPGWEPLVIVSGPVIDALEFNYLAGVLRIGRQANSTVGRFARLFMRNVCELRIPPGSTDKGTIGMNFNVALAENEAVVREIGWPTFGQDHGCGIGDSMVTLVGVISVTPPIYSHGADPTVHLDAIGKILGVGASAAFLIGAVLFPPYWHPLVVMSPMIARLIAGGGVDKTAMRRYLHDNATISPYELERYVYLMEGRHGLGNFDHNSTEMLRLFIPDFDESVRSGIYSSDATMPTFPWPERIEIVVAGDPSRNQSRGYVTSHKFGAPVSQKVEFPSAWTELYAEAMTRRQPLTYGEG